MTKPIISLIAFDDAPVAGVETSRFGAAWIAEEQPPIVVEEQPCPQVAGLAALPGRRTLTAGRIVLKVLRFTSHPRQADRPKSTTSSIKCGARALPCECPKPFYEVLESQLQSEAELPLIDAVAAQIGDAGDASEVVQVGDCAVRIQDHVRHIPIGIREMWGVAEIERLHPELELESLGETELTVYAEIPVDEAWAAKGAETRGTEARLRNGREGQGIEERHVASDTAQLLNTRFNLVGTLC